MSKRPICSALGLFLLYSMPTQVQLGHMGVKAGTAAVIFYSKNTAIFAAESRVVLVGKSIRHRDDACKVHAVNNKFIFVSAGVNGFEPDSRESGNGWSAYDEPGRLADQIPDTAEDPVNTLAQLWGEAMERHLDRALEVNPGPMLRFLHLEDTQSLTTAMFAGRTKQGQFVMYDVVLNCDCAGNSRHAVLKISPEPLADRSKTIALGMKEVTALMDELIHESSDRARTATDKFGAAHAGLSPSELRGAAAVASLQFILQYAKSEDIGGSIDAVEMSSAGTVHWIQRKDNCPDQR